MAVYDTNQPTIFEQNHPNFYIEAINDHLSRRFIFTLYRKSEVPLKFMEHVERIYPVTAVMVRKEVVEEYLATVPRDLSILNDLYETWFNEYVNKLTENE